ncbi:MAG: cytochrome c3 family protein [bacterium]|nr:cytochrome c3 family protein [bacterium]
MRSRTVTVLLLVGILLTAVSLVISARNLRLPGVDTGHQPAQPIAYSHRLHAGELAIPCLYCHFAAEKSRRAGIPPASVCMNCHQFVTATLGALREEEKLAKEENRDIRPVESPELRKLYDALALDPDLRPESGRESAPIVWSRVHDLPDFAYFDHRPHVAATVACQSCHGPVETMELVRQDASLTMGWCVKCHRENSGRTESGKPVDPPLDCATCHY